jgi:hypothetical protein
VRNLEVSALRTSKMREAHDLTVMGTNPVHGELPNVVPQNPRSPVI